MERPSFTVNNRVVSSFFWRESATCARAVTTTRHITPSARVKPALPVDSNLNLTPRIDFSSRVSPVFSKKQFESRVGNGPCFEQKQPIYGELADFERAELLGCREPDGTTLRPTSILST